GVIVPLSGLARVLAEWFISVHWGQKVLERLLPEGDLTLMRRPVESWFWPFLIILVHAVAVCIAASVLLGKSHGRGRARWHSARTEVRWLLGMLTHHATRLKRCDTRLEACLL